MVAVWRTGATFVAAWVAERLLGRAFPRQGAAPRPALPPPPSFSPEQIALFAREEGGERRFLPDIEAGVRETLRLRSVLPVQIPDLGDRVAAWVVCPLRSGSETAADAADRLAARGARVLVSLSAVLLRTGAPCPALVLAVSPADAARLAAPGGHFAALSPPAARASSERDAPGEPPADPPAEVPASPARDAPLATEPSAARHRPRSEIRAASPRANGAAAARGKEPAREAGERDRPGE